MGLLLRNRGLGLGFTIKEQGFRVCVLWGCLWHVGLRKHALIFRAKGAPAKSTASGYGSPSFLVGVLRAAPKPLNPQPRSLAMLQAWTSYGKVPEVYPQHLLSVPQTLLVPFTGDKRAIIGGTLALKEGRWTVCLFPEEPEGLFNNTCFLCEDAKKGDSRRAVSGMRR